MQSNQTLMQALAPLANIWQAYLDNNLDDEARRYWGPVTGKEFTNDVGNEESVELYSGRGGGTLLTLAHCRDAFELFHSQWDFTNILTCVYCGHQYPEGTPPAHSQILTDHIKVCEKHPMRESELEISMLQKSMLSMIGADSIEELENIISLMKRLPDSENKRVGVPFCTILLASLKRSQAIA